MKTIQEAQISDYPRIKELLRACDLHESDIKSQNQSFFVIKENDAILATACIEAYGSNAIFRSFAVESKHRNQQLGTSLYKHVLDTIRNDGINSLYLLTTTASDYFAKQGWIRIKRNTVPKEVQQSSEFSEICPSSAICMFLALENGSVKDSVATFLEDLNCSQSVFSAFAPSLGLDRKTALKLSTGFGGGIAGKGEICGAVSGAYLTLGLRFGRSEKEDLESKQKTLDVIAEFDALFLERNGSLYCSKLLGGDMSKSEEKQKLIENKSFENICPQFIKDAAEILNQIIDQ